MSDRGGWPAGPVQREGHETAGWERLTDGIVLTLARKRILTIDELRRAMEDFPRGEYESLGYYQRWLSAIEALLIEKGLATREEIDRATAP